MIKKIKLITTVAVAVIVMAGCSSTDIEETFSSIKVETVDGTFFGKTMGVKYENGERLYDEKGNIEIGFIDLDGTIYRGDTTTNDAEKNICGGELVGHCNTMGDGYLIDHCQIPKIDELGEKIEDGVVVGMIGLAYLAFPCGNIIEEGK